MTDSGRARRKNRAFYLALILFFPSACSVTGSAEDLSVHDRRVQEYKDRYRFEVWQGRVKIKGSIPGLGSLPQELSLLFDFQVLSATAEWQDQLSVQILDKADGRRLALVNVAEQGEPLKAQKVFFETLVYDSSLAREVKAEKGTNFDIGDMCMYIPESEPPVGVSKVVGRPYIARLFFSRNNVSVSIRNEPKKGQEYLDVLFVAKVLDRLLCNHIVEDASGAKPGPG